MEDNFVLEVGTHYDKLMDAVIKKLNIGMDKWPSSSCSEG